MIKWQPFNSVIDGSILMKDLNKKRNKIKKPILSENQIEEINFYLTKGLELNYYLKIKCYKDNSIKTIKGYIKSINKYSKYLMLEDNTKIKFSEIIEISA